MEVSTMFYIADTVFLLGRGSSAIVGTEVETLVLQLTLTQMQ